MGAETVTPSPPTPGLLNTRILVTDDHPEMLTLMERALGDSYECEFATSTEQAHEKLDTGSFQLAICNLESADSKGLDLAEEIVRDYPDTATVVPGLATSRRQLHRQRSPSGNSFRMWPMTSSPESAANTVCEHGAMHLKSSGIS